MNAHDILKAAAGHMSDRAATYDRPSGERSMGATVEAFKAVSGIGLTEGQGWLFMALLKAVRSQQGAYRADSYEDGAAYFALAGEAAHAASHAADAMPATLGKQNAFEPASQIDDTRPDIVTSSHGDGDHCAELEKRERWKNPPEWATCIVERLGYFRDFAQERADGSLAYVIDGQEVYTYGKGWKIVESRP